MKKRAFLKSIGALAVSVPTMKLSALERIGEAFSSTERFPTVFIGHGSPMNAIVDSPFTRALHQLGKKLPRPQAVLVISAHWETAGTFVSTNPSPKTIYDFGGFADQLYQQVYEPKGHPDLAKATLAAIEGAKGEPNMGLDHGAWTVLKHVFPNADIPVFQLSLDYRKPPAYHYRLAQQLKRLRNKGVLILGSGNIVHNLRRSAWGQENAKPFDWAVEFDQKIWKYLENRNDNALINYHLIGNAAQLSVPTNDHYLPLIYTLAATDPSESIQSIFEGYHYAGISMRCFQIG